VCRRLAVRWGDRAAWRWRYSRYEDDVRLICGDGRGVIGACRAVRGACDPRGAEAPP